MKINIRIIYKLFISTYEFYKMTNLKKSLLVIVFIINGLFVNAQTDDSLGVSEGIYNEKVTIDDEESVDNDNEKSNQKGYPESKSGERIRIYSGKQDGMNVIYDSDQSIIEPKPKEKIRIYSGSQDGNNIIYDPRW